MIIIVLTWIFYNNSCFNIVGVSILFIIVMVIFSLETFVLYDKLQAAYTENFKQVVIHPMIKFIDDDLNYQPNKEITPKKFYTSLFFKDEYGKKIDNWQAEDHINGTLDRIPMTFSEINAEEVRERGDTTTTITIFEGLFFSFKMKTNFKGIILLNVHEELWRKRFSSWWLKKSIKKVKLEELKLADNLTVYSDNPLMVSQLFSNNFQTNLLTLQRRIKRPIHLSFIDNKLYLAISTKKKLFEVSMFKQVSYELVEDSFNYLQIGIEIMKMVKNTNFGKNYA
ncbi:DUF3137 domain-containing protein [Candidatus Halobeggiatoa sp. HSG11]|nr:DUF3137 domain-containing protein [Candidatus Halobeggiatoa sp. HSG11]